MTRQRHYSADDCDHDEAQAQPRCFWQDAPATTTLDGTPLCATHACCARCEMALTTKALTCRCDQDGYLGHEEALWCSWECLEASHPPRDEDDYWRRKGEMIGTGLVILVGLLLLVSFSAGYLFGEHHGIRWTVGQVRKASGT